MPVTKQLLGNETRKSILYLDQNFLSSVHRGGIQNEWVAALMAKVTRALDLQLLAIPYSSTHIEEADLNGDYRDALVQFIQGVSRGHQFEPYYRVEETQIVKAFQCFLDHAPPVYQKEESDALSPSVHDWDSDYSVSVFSSARDADRRSLSKQRAVDELLQVLPQWAKKGRTFQQDMDLEISDAARLLIDSWTDKAARLAMGDFSALFNAPICSSIAASQVQIVQFIGELMKYNRHSLNFGLYLLVLVGIAQYLADYFEIPIWPAYMCLIFFFVDQMDTKKVPHIVVGGVAGIAGICFSRQSSHSLLHISAPKRGRSSSSWFWFTPS